jgi:hypothetical protein
MTQDQWEGRPQTAARRRRPRKSFVVFMVAMALCALASWWLLAPPSDDTKPFSDGRLLANKIIELGRAGSGSLAASELAEIVCYAPEGTIYPPARAKLLLPEYSIEYLETIQTDGYWWIIIGKPELKKAWIYAIPQHVLSWSTPETARAVDYTRCASTLQVSFDQAIPAFTPIQ